MQKIFKEYGGVISVAIAIVCLVGIVGMMLGGAGGGVMGNAFSTVVDKFDSKVESAINGGGAGSVTYEMLDGDGAVVNTVVYSPLSFRSSAPIDKFQDVKVDGTIVDSSNYTVSEGSTIVTFNAEYTQALSKGDHEVEIVSNDGSAAGTFSINSSNVIPEGAFYIQGDIIYEAGDKMPSDVNVFDGYVYGDYLYALDDETGWKVLLGTQNIISGIGIENYPCATEDQTSYSVILESINGTPVTNMEDTFYSCTKLTTAPVIPNGVTNMRNAFYGCTALTTAPVIPNNVTDMRTTFSGCTALTTAPPVIPSSVTNMYETFLDCTSLTTVPNMSDATNVTEMYRTFSGCTALTTAPVIPNSVTKMEKTFEGCTALATAPVIPNNVKGMCRTFFGCTALTTAPVIPESVTDMQYTFQNCTSLIVAPAIPNNVVYLTYTFSGCTALTTAPVIPNNVKGMSRTFSGCTALTTAPVIPESVTNMQYAFQNCTSLTGTIIINANVKSDMTYGFCFSNVDFDVQNLILEGSCLRLDYVGKTGINYCVDCNGKCLNNH